MNNKSTYNQILTTEEDTVVFEYIQNKFYKGSLQSEQQLEDKFIKDLINLGYEYLDFSKYDKSKHLKELENNLRNQLEKLNDIRFSDNEWSKLYKSINKDNMDYLDATQIIQEDYIITLTLDNGIDKNIYLLDKKNVNNNNLQVINQYIDIYGIHEVRYDVTILVNGIPLVQIELKRRGNNLEEAFNQINRYKESSFTNLYRYVQLFVISNGTETKYYSNTTRHISVNINDESKEIKSKASRSFKFTMYWSDQKNNIISELEDFTHHFFNKRTISNILTKYCIFTYDRRLLIMRPYQIAATEKIINKIIISNNYKEFLGTTRAGGYIWHTTGSGKTVTSFKAAQLLENIDFIDKVLFVVDRKDLDYQTINEYNKFKKGSANSTSSTKELQQVLEKESEDSKIIVTTIQKLSTFIKKNHGHSVFKKHVVLIFDECHRSQFGDMHKAIIKNFKKYNIFGFTGTPIFAENATLKYGGNKINTEIDTNKFNVTTEQLFGDCLHQYIIIDAIKDGNVLKFRYNQIEKTFDKKTYFEDEDVYSINTKEVLEDDERVSNIVRYILDNFNKQTMRNESYKFDSITNINEIAKKKKQTIEEKRSKIDVKGFNSIFAISNISLLKKYYLEFKRQLENRNDIDLKIATIFSYAPNEQRNDVDEFIEFDDENNESVDSLDKSSRDFLEEAIKDYNKMFGTTFDTSNEKYQNYYRHLSLSVKNKEIDILLVVNMFLTGFDAPTLNTLWVDKWLNMHGLIQAFSRTNRIFNKIKHHANIVSFRPLKKELDKAITIYSQGSNKTSILIKSFNDYYYGYKDESTNIEEPGYLKVLEQIKNDYGIMSHSKIYTIEDKVNFMHIFGKLLRLRNILLSFEEFVGDDIRQITDREMQDYLGWYQKFNRELKEDNDSKTTSILGDIVFEKELVDQNDNIDVDYISKFIFENKEKFGLKDKEIKTELLTILNSSPRLSSKKELIELFINLYNEEIMNGSKSYEDIEENIYDLAERRKNELLEELASNENLDIEKVRDFFEECLRQGSVKIIGDHITKLFKEKLSRFSKANNTISDYSKKKSKVIEELDKLLDQFIYIL